jgi:DNA-binding response OmpR family regulator
VLYRSNYTDGRIIVHGLEVKGANYSQKPFTVDGLPRRMRDILGKNTDRSKLL